jgi:hypothetical protein
MPAMPRTRRPPTDDWDQLRLLVGSPEQETYELLRPIVLFGQSSTGRAKETGVAARTLRRKATRFADVGMRSLFEPDEPSEPDRRRLPLGIRTAIVTLKAEYPALTPFAIARICQHRFDRSVSYHTVAKVLATTPRHDMLDTCLHSTMAMERRGSRQRLTRSSRPLDRVR